MTKMLHDSRTWVTIWVKRSKSTSPTFIVEAVRDLVPYDDADATVVERLREVLAVEVRLQDSGGEH